MIQKLFGEYTVEHSNAKVGRLTVSQQGLMTHFSCECVVAAAEILRLAVLTGDRYVALGVLLPAGDKLRFAKSYSKNDLRQKGIHSIDGCRLASKHDALVPSVPPIQQLDPTPQPESAPIIEPTPQPEPAPAPEPKIMSPPASEIMSPQPLVAQVDSPAELESIVETATDITPQWEVQELSDDAVLLTHSARIEATEHEPALDLSLPEARGDTEEGLVPASGMPREQSEPIMFSEENTGIYAPWTSHPSPGILFTDPDLEAAASRVTGALTRPCGGDCIELAVPFEAGAPFPLMPVFCQGRAIEIDSNAHLVFRINNGKLVEI